MADFQFTVEQGYLGLKVTPLRVDKQPGNILPGGALTYKSLDETVATVTRQPGQPNGFDEVRVFPASPAKLGTVTVTASGVDENGAPVETDFTVAIVADADPTSQYAFTQIHP